MARNRSEVDPIGSRMKEKYEAPCRLFVPQRTYLIVRVDGRSFHTYTRTSERPYDRLIAEAMDAGAMALCAEMMGCRFAYGQSDEYSFLATDFETLQTEAWFKGNIQKIASIAASIFTGAFNFARMGQAMELGMKLDGPEARGWMGASFDARVFVIPSRSEVENYFIWRQQDASRNSLNMLASFHYSHQELLGATASERHELLHQRGVNWNDCPTDQKRGRVVVKRERTRLVSYVHKRSQERVEETVAESYWALDSDIPVFTQNRQYLGGLIPEQD